MRKFSKKNQKLPLIGLIILYLITGTMYILVTPGFEKPDEDGHYGYILYLQEKQALPPLRFAEGFSSEYKQPPLYYLLAAGATSWLPLTDQPERLLEVNPYMYHSVPGQRNDNRNVFLHPPHLTPVMIGSRVVSLLFGLGAMLATGLIARQIAPDDARLPFVAAAIVGFHPKFFYLATAINNDVPVAFFGTVVLLLLIRRLRRGRFRHFALLTGAMLGLASLTKVSGLVFFPLTALALLLIHRGWDRALVREGLSILGVALLVGGGWYARNALVYHDPLSINVHVADATTLRPFGDRFFADLLSVEHTFWANPARSFVSRTRLGDLLVWWGRLSLGASLLWLLRRFRPWRLDADAATWVILLSWPVTFAALLLGYWTRTATWAYGRLLFPAMASFALLFAWGWAAIFPRRWRRFGLMMSVGALMVASALVPWLSIAPLYWPWRPYREDAVAHAAEIDYLLPESETPVARLLGYEVLTDVAEPGSYLPIKLCWEPLAHTPTPYALFVQVLDASQMDAPAVWGSRRTYPGLGNKPTDRWALRQPFCSRVTVLVSEDAPTPFGATLEIGFIEPEMEARLRPATPVGEPLGLATVRGVPVVSADAMADPQALLYRLDQAITLTGVGVGAVDEAQGGPTLPVTLTWQVTQSVPYDATVFIHLDDAEGNRVAQIDRQPLDARFPTSYWVPGQVVTDTYALPLKIKTESLPLQTPLEMRLGMYTWPSLARLPVVDAAGAPQRDDVVALSIPLVPSTVAAKDDSISGATP